MINILGKLFYFFTGGSEGASKHPPISGFYKFQGTLLEGKKMALVLYLCTDTKWPQRSHLYSKALQQRSFMHT